MSLWKDTPGKDTGTKDPFATGSSTPRESEKIFTATASVVREPAISTKPGMPALKESYISPDLVIEGKIEGSGHVRIAGRFKGDIQVQGNVTIENGAQVTGEVKADMIVLGGELNGNVSAGSRVELQSTGVLNGDLTAGSLVVAAGSRMRGQVEFGWSDNKANKP